MARKKKPIRTDIGWSDTSSITLFGRDFPSEILGAEIKALRASAVVG